MKLFKTVFVLFAVIVSFYAILSCERDDICAEDTATTPLLIIKFIDDVTASDIKQPVDLAITSTDLSITDSIQNVTSRDSIMIPLKTNDAITELSFIINARNADQTLVNSDIVSFQYTIQQDYVSSACGFKVSYKGITQSLTADTDNWIKGIEIKKENVTDETSAHILIYH